MTVVDYIDLDDDECYVKVDFVDLSTDEDSVEKEGNGPEDDNVARSENVAKAAVSLSISEQHATPTTSLSNLDQENAATAPLSMVEHCDTTSSVMAEETIQPEYHKFLATSSVAKEAMRSANHGLIAAGDLVGEAMQSEHEAEDFIFSSMTEQGASTSLLLINQGDITSSMEDNAIQFGNQVFVTAVDCAKEATQSENIAKAAGSSSVTERCVMGMKGDAGNAMGSTITYNIHAQENPEGDSEKNENCNFEAEPAALCQEVSQDVLAMSLPQDKVKEISQCRKLYRRKGNKKVNTSAREFSRQLSIVHSKGVRPTLQNGHSGFSVMGNVRDGTSSTGINVPDGEVVGSTYQGCSKTFQGNTMDVKIRDCGSEGCMVEGCTNGAHEGTPLGVFHNSWPHKRCCAVIGCTTAACTSIGGRTGCCAKHGGGKRCKYDGCGKAARGKTDYCIAHGGGRRCKFQGCRKSAPGRSDYCTAHGEGRRCKFLPPLDKEKGKKQVNTSATECNRQLSIVHSNGVAPTLHNGDNGFSVMGNVLNCTASIGINVFGGEVVVSNYQGCSKTSQGNTMHGKVRDSGSEDCMVEDCTNGAHGGTHLCIFHNSRPNKRCCAVTGCTKIACNQGRTDRCVKHGGGKRCKYDGCGKGAQGTTDYCIAHGGGRRCKFQGCMKSAQGRSDYCVKHGGGRRCTFLECSGSATYGKGLCSLHRTSLSSGNNSDHEMLPALAHQAKKSEPSKRRNSHSVIGGRSQKRQNTNDYGNTAVETGEREGRTFVCQNNMLKAQQTTRRMNSESGLAVGSPPRKFRKVAEVYT